MKLIRFLLPLTEICHPPKNSKSWKTRGSARDAIGRTPASFSSHVVTWPVVWGARSKAKDARCVGRGWERKFALICHNVLAFINDLWNSTFIEWKLAWNWRAFLWRQNWWWINEYASKHNLWGNPKFYQPFFVEPRRPVLQILKANKQWNGIILLFDDWELQAYRQF